MNRVRRARRFRTLAGLLACALAMGAPAQETASTLASLTARAEVIVVADVAAAPQGRGGTLTAEFATRASLKGAAPLTFGLSEPAGRSCGRALLGLQGRYVLFLQRRNAGFALVVSNGRCVVPAAQAVIDHVRELAAAASPTACLEVLSHGLASPEARVRDDAAMALPYAPGLELADAAARQRIADALDRSLTDAGRGMGALLLAAERLELEAARPRVLEAFLAGDHPHAERLMLRVLPRLGGAEVARHVGRQLPADPRGRVRAARLLGRLPAAAAREPLETLLASPHQDAAAQAAAALLGHGVDQQWLASRCTPEVLQAARRAAAPQPTFRSIRPGRSP